MDVLIAVSGPSDRSPGNFTFHASLLKEGGYLELESFSRFVPLKA
jgi:hypothetical protein